MMLTDLRFIIICTFCGFYTHAFAQTVDFDSLSVSYCECLNNLEKEQDSLKILYCYQEQVIPALSSMKIDDDSLFNIYLIKLELTFRKNCPYYLKMMNRLTPPQGDWKLLDSLPRSSADVTTCSSILNHEEYFYIEANGDTTYVELSEAFWIDHFRGGTYSILKFNWVDDCDFNVRFVESNDPIRANYSKKGDKYFYRIIERRKDHYLLATIIYDQIYEFKLYFK